MTAQVIRLSECEVCHNQMDVMGRYDISKTTCSAICANKKWQQNNPESYKQKRKAQRQMMYAKKKSQSIDNETHKAYNCKCGFCKFERRVTSKIKTLAYPERFKEQMRLVKERYVKSARSFVS